MVKKEDSIAWILNLSWVTSTEQVNSFSGPDFAVGEMWTMIIPTYCVRVDTGKQCEALRSVSGT